MILSSDFTQQVNFFAPLLFLKNERILLKNEQLIPQNEQILLKNERILSGNERFLFHKSRRIRRESSGNQRNLANLLGNERIRSGMSDSA